MSAMYNNNLDKEKITGGIVGIWAKMCTDSILRNKLFEKGEHICAHNCGVYLIVLRVVTERVFWHQAFWGSSGHSSVASPRVIWLWSLWRASLIMEGKTPERRLQNKAPFLCA